MAVDPAPAVAAGRLPGAREAAALATALVPGGLGASFAAVAVFHGRYFPTSWGWTSLAFLALAAVVLVLRPPRIDRRELAFIGALGALAAWIGLSALWSPSPGESISELERALVYAAGALTLLLCVSRA